MKDNNIEKVLISMPVQFKERIKSVQENEGYVSFSEAVRALISVGLRKINPAYVNQKPAPKRSAIEKVFENKKAKEIMEELDKLEVLKMVEEMEGVIVDKHGNKDKNGDYFKYKTYTYVPGNPPKIGITEEKNPLYMIKDLVGSQYDGETKHKIKEILESGNYTKIN